MTLDGVVLVDKPEGMTSFAVDICMRKIADTKKVGHLGTLDPFATGMLPVFCGKGLKYMRFCEGWDKSYNCRALFGKTTDTMDITGETVTENYPSDEAMAELERTDYAAVRQAFAAVAETEEQIPPKYSAKKIGGRRACDLARDGVEFELKSTKIKIYSIDINSIERQAQGFIVDFDVRCSKGTYIRTICDDAGRMTGFGACAVTLRRTAVGPYSISEAKTPDELRALKEAGDMSFLLSAEDALSDMPALEMSSRQAADLRFGKKIPFDIEADQEGRTYYRACREGKLIAVVYPAEEGGRTILRIERLFDHD